MTQLPFSIVLPTSNWKPPKGFPNLSSAKVLSIDFETRDPNISKDMGPGWPTHNGEIVGVAAAAPGWKGYYPIRHEGGGNVDADSVIKWTKSLLESKIPKVFHNAIYDCGWATTEGIAHRGEIHDTQFMAALLDEYRDDYSLDAVCRDYGIEGKDESVLKAAALAYGVDPKGGLYKLPAKYVGAYAEQDAAATLSLYERLAPLIEKEELTKVYTLERELIPLLILMRQRGVRVDEERAHSLKKDLKKRINDTLDTLVREWGIRVDIWSSKSLQKVFQRLKLPYSVTEKGNPSFKKDALRGIDHPVIRLIEQARKASTTISLVCEGMIETYAVNGRIHCEMHPLKRSEEEGRGGTVGGRFSSTHPNLQQVTKRDKDLALLVRALFLPEEGQSWLQNDYSQQEYRLIVHDAVVSKFKGWEIAAKAYENPDTDFHEFVAQLTGLPRTNAKNINFGIAYTMGITKLAAQLGISIPAAQMIMNQYHAHMPFVREFVKAASRVASTRGYIKTILGRRCRFPMYELAERNQDFHSVVRGIEAAHAKWPGKSVRRAYTHKAVNRRIQGSAADMTKKAMLDCYRAGFVPLLQVHDELDFSVSDPACARQINTIMCQAIPLRIPMKVDTSIGPNWAELKRVTIS